MPHAKKDGRRVRKKNIRVKGQFVCTPSLKLSTEKQKNQNEFSTKKVFHISKCRSDIQQNREGAAGKFTSQGDAHVRSNAQIKFLSYPLLTQLCEFKLFLVDGFIFPDGSIFLCIRSDGFRSDAKKCQFSNFSLVLLTVNKLVLSMSVEQDACVYLQLQI